MAIRKYMVKSICLFAKIFVEYIKKKGSYMHLGVLHSKSNTKTVESGTLFGKAGGYHGE